MPFHNMSTAVSIPYERQSDSQANRGCGAACLSMVYRSFGQEIPQAEIWPVIAKENRIGQISSTTYLMAQDALRRGFIAVAIQARHPLQALRLCRAGNICAILNHRVRRDSAAGHYSVLVDIDGKDVIVHDPLLGAARRLPHAELLELWLPHIPNSEIVGGVLIAVAAPGSSKLPACEFCHTSMPPRITCPRCSKPTGLEPGAVLGCIRDGCIARMWNWVCCPACVYVFTVKDGSAATPEAIAKPSAGASSSGGLVVDLDEVFAGLDKFTSHVLGIPGAADHPELKTQLQLLETTKAELKSAHSRGIARRGAIFEQLAALAEKHQQKKEAQLKKIEERNAPAPPLEGNVLGNALLKNLGFK
jgi:hypothetical protein